MLENDENQVPGGMKIGHPGELDPHTYRANFTLVL